MSDILVGGFSHYSLARFIFTWHGVLHNELEQVVEALFESNGQNDKVVDDEGEVVEGEDTKLET